MVKTIGMMTTDELSPRPRTEPPDQTVRGLCGYQRVGELAKPPRRLTPHTIAEVDVGAVAAFEIRVSIHRHQIFRIARHRFHGVLLRGDWFEPSDIASRPPRSDECTVRTRTVPGPRRQTKC